MLRRHNPGLAARVRLDEKGKLQVFDLEEVKQEWDRLQQETQGQLREGKHSVSGLQILNRQKPSEQVSDVLNMISGMTSA